MMEQPSRPRYEDISPDDSFERLSPRFDCVEPKYDGMWATIEITGDDLRSGGGRAEIYTRTGKLKATVDVPCNSRLRAGVRYRLHGEYLKGTNWAKRSGMDGQIVVFDCTLYDGIDLREKGLGVRRMMARGVVGKLGYPFRMTKSFLITKCDRLWETAVLHQGFEGLVVKNSEAPFGSPWGRIKREHEVDYVCMGFNQSSAPRFAGAMVKSIEAGLYINGELVRVAAVSGLTDYERVEMHQDPESFIGRAFKAHGKGVFPSGALRHPSFAGWHEKDARECTLEAAQDAVGFLAASAINYPGYSCL